MLSINEKENKQEICNAFLKTLQLTRAAGVEEYNPLVELRYIQKENGDEIVRPIFADGNGENGYYDVNVTCDSGIAVLIDVMKWFVGKVW